MEGAWIADYGRDWLRDADGASTRMISDVELDHHELIWVDRKMFWQIAGSVAILHGTAGGAFILSYFTHAYSLGCRSGGYLTYVTLATAIFAAKMILWWVRATFWQVLGCIPEWMKHLPFEDRISRPSERTGRILDVYDKHQWLHIV
ncbi:hypothetical protein ABVK25_004781 [Lepraria finkii]|uniref:Uncharacterized protein n=1 Tax=Lepraria finkii TaxID=1340010 RepID=A0ABR4BAS7_9LECA